MMICKKHHKNVIFHNKNLISSNAESPEPPVRVAGQNIKLPQTVNLAS